MSEPICSNELLKNAQEAIAAADNKKRGTKEKANGMTRKNGVKLPEGANGQNNIEA